MTMKIYSDVPTSAFEREFQIKRIGVSKGSGYSRLTVPWNAFVSSNELTKPNAFDMAKLRANRLGGRLQVVDGVNTFVFQRESAFALRIDVIKSRIE
jgi:hypothetical protein